MADDVYLKLREYLDGLPGGFPENDGGVAVKILEKLFTPLEAEMAACLRMVPESASAVAERLGKDGHETGELLESMARRGLIYRVRAGDDVLYMSINFIAGIYEFQLNNLDREFAELMEEYLPHLFKTTWANLKTGQFRVVPVNSAVETLPEVATYDRVRDLISEQQLISVAPCICRRERGVLGHECDRPHEVCLSFGPNAQFYIDNGLGREINTGEALEILARAEESALVLCPNNAQRILNLCCCCSCCCGLLRTLRSMERPADMIHSSFQARIDPDSCSACGSCLERCQMGAIIEWDDFMEVDTARCIGCGLCLSNCPEESITMPARPESEIPPRNIVETFGKISAERGLSIQ
jgi:electron transport complex protein RnfB